VRENKSDPNRWTTERSEAEALPKLGEGLPPSRSAFEELRKYPFFFANDDADERGDLPPSSAPHTTMERSATLPPLPRPSAEIRPLLVHPAPGEARAEVTAKVAEKKPESTVAAATAASLAERHTAALARRQNAPTASPPPVVAAAERVVPVERPVPIEPAAPIELDDEPAMHTPRPRVPHIHPAAQAIAQESAGAREPWYSRVPTGASLIATILYFLIGGVALIGTGLVLGGLGGGLMALFGLVVTSVAAFVAWQELTNKRR
jgi:hypothetical protein